MSMRAVKKAVKRSKDDFENGTIIAWTSAERYTYAAIKTPVGWYTTASDRAAWTVEKVITFEEVLKILARGESGDVRVIGLNDGTRVTG
jgi:cytochrome bd-type quinol oxidase subunit 1